MIWEPGAGSPGGRCSMMVMMAPFRGKRPKWLPASAPPPRCPSTSNPCSHTWLTTQSKGKLLPQPPQAQHPQLASVGQDQPSARTGRFLACSSGLTSPPDAALATEPEAGPAVEPPPFIPSGLSGGSFSAASLAQQLPLSQGQSPRRQGPSLSSLLPGLCRRGREPQALQLLEGGI